MSFLKSVKCIPPNSFNGGYVALVITQSFNDHKHFLGKEH